MSSRTASKSRYAAKTEILAAAVEFVRDVPTEHTGPNDDDVKRITAVVADLGPGAARPSAENVMREFRLLDIDEYLRVRIETGQHGGLLLGFR
jgi:hypothetical protein